MQVELEAWGLRAEFESRIPINYKNVIVGDYQADLFVGDAVIVEVKVARSYCPDGDPQSLNELKATVKKVSLLRTKVEFERFVF